MLWSQFSAIFNQYSAHKLAFFSKTNDMFKFLQKLAVVWTKNANIFAKFFGENILKIITSDPDRASFRALSDCLEDCRSRQLKF
jgi:hypothetical protein